MDMAYNALRRALTKRARLLLFGCISIMGGGMASLSYLKYNGRFEEEQNALKTEMREYFQQRDSRVERILDMVQKDHAADKAAASGSAAVPPPAQPPTT